MALDPHPRDADLAQITASRRLSFPIATKADFVAQMTSGDEPVLFRGESYDARFAANLIPEFFFPVASEEDLTGKAEELLIARGLTPLGDRER